MFAILSTSFGKTLCFACLPFVFDDLSPVSPSSIILVVTPLLSSHDVIARDFNELIRNDVTKIKWTM